MQPPKNGGGFGSDDFPEKTTWIVDFLVTSKCENFFEGVSFAKAQQAES